MDMRPMATDMVMATNHQTNNTLPIFLQKRSHWVFFALSLVLTLPLLYLFWKFNEAGFGYDIGIYRHFAIEYFKEILNPKINPFAFSSFSNFVFLLGDSLNSFLIGWYILLSVFTAYTFAVLVRKTTNSPQVAYFAILLFSTSILQFEFFANFYYRNILALFLMFITLLLLEHKTFFAALPFLILSAIHPLTTLVLAPSLFLIGVFQKEKRRLFFITLLTSGILSILLSWTEFLHYISTLFGFLQNKKAVLEHSSEFTGQFVNSLKFFRFSLPYLPFALLGIFREWKKHMFWSIFGLINLLLIVFQFFLFERFYLFLNITLIFFAAHGIFFVFQLFQNKKVFHILVFTYSAILLCAQLLYVSQKMPFISPTELAKIRQLHTIIPTNSFLISFSSYDAAWLYGFTQTYKIIAPGTLDENKWNYAQWQEFWSKKDIKKRADLLTVYNTKELYIYVNDAQKGVAQELFSRDPHIQIINSHIWKYQFSPSL